MGEAAMAVVLARLVACLAVMAADLTPRCRSCSDRGPCVGDPRHRDSPRMTGPGDVATHAVMAARC